MSATDALRHKHSSLMPQKNGGKCASLYKLALTGGMRELSQTFDPSANIAKGHPQGQGPAKGGLESLPRPQIQFTGPCTALLQRAAAIISLKSRDVNCENPHFQFLAMIFHISENHLHHLFPTPCFRVMLNEGKQKLGINS